MHKGLSKALQVTTALLLLSLCGACSLTDKREILKVAYEAVKADPNFPKGATLQPIERCIVFDGKNAATVDVPFDVAGASGRVETLCYQVWVKRIATRWELDGFRIGGRFVPPKSAGG